MPVVMHMWHAWLVVYDSCCVACLPTCSYMLVIGVAHLPICICYVVVIWGVNTCHCFMAHLLLPIIMYMLVVGMLAYLQLNDSYVARMPSG